MAEYVWRALNLMSEFACSGYKSPKRYKFATGVKIKVKGESKIDDSPK